jgi:lysophospholipase L1-like esterase/mannose-6-phosphate isomerase-like protein (cupin superfamily)
MNGRSTRTFIEEGRWAALLEEVRPGDYVLIQFGHNDQSKRKPDRYTPPGDFQANLARFAGDISALGATPVLVTPVARRRFDETGTFYDSHGEYPDLVRDVARRSGTALIDLHERSIVFLEAYGAERSKNLFLWLEPGDSDNYPEGLEDNTHFSPLGARAMASLVMHGILEQLPGLAKQLLKTEGGIVQDADIAYPDGGPHSGGGETTGHWFFKDSGTPFVFRKRVMHPGSAIGYHLHDKDEIYYILEGNGELVFNGEASRVGPGTAILTRPGDSHGLRPIGEEDLVLIIVYESKAPAKSKSSMSSSGVD